MKELSKKNKNEVLIKAANCLNCGYPFYSSEKFCPECGQENKDKRITFKEFINEIFNGFISWDAKFWTTIIPLLTKPGKVSRDYIEGKRMRYANPFRFYLSVSVLFFLILGVTESYNTFKELQNGKTEKGLKVHKKTTQDSLKPKPANTITVKSNFFADANKYYAFQQKHPNLEIESALDSLKAKHTFLNRFVYSRFQAIDKILKNSENQRQITKQLISYTSISLFILLPLFTLFLKFFYIGRKFTYVEHLIFVFHTQTVFFLMLTLLFFINFFMHKDYITTIFLLLFLVYLFLAMKHFYKQRVIKTFLKFMLLNISFFFISTIGFVFVTLIAFALY